MGDFYEQYFTFKITGPFNLVFTDFGIGDLVFLNNIGSIPGFIVILILGALFWRSLLFISKKCYKKKYCRKIGMFA